MGVNRSWSGSYGGTLGHDLKVDGIWEFGKDEQVIEGVAQISGMSGAAAINGKGYTGCVHGMKVLNPEKSLSTNRQ